MSLDWRSTRSTNECLQHICLTETLSDVTFVFSRENGKIIPAHKLILAVRSCVFEAMFYGPTASDMIKIEDENSNTFSDILRYLYTDSIKLTGENVLECLYTAKKYQVDGLARMCSDFLATALTVDNACELFNQAIVFDEKQLAEKCLSFVCENASDVLRHQSFTKLSYPCLVSILQSDNLNVDNEIDVFKATIRWSTNQCQNKGSLPDRTNMRSVLGDAFHLIRLPTIELQTFTDIVVHSGLLTIEEENELYRCMTTSSRKSRKFPSTARVGSDVEIVFVGQIIDLGRLEDRQHVRKMQREGYACQLSLSCQSNVQLRKVSFDHEVTGALAVQLASDYEVYSRPVSGKGIHTFCANVNNSVAVFDNGPIFENGISYDLHFLMNDLISQRNIFTSQRVRISVKPQSNKFGIALNGTSTFIRALHFAACQNGN